MNTKILVGHDGNSPQSEDALCMAEGLAAISGASLVLARVEPSGAYDLVPARVEEERREALEHLNAVADGLRARGRSVEIADLRFGPPARALQEMAEADSIALIVVGSSHRGRVGTVLAGTVGVRLLHGAPCPVAVAPRGLAETGQWRPELVGIAYDDTPEARAALEEARQVALNARATLKVIAIAEVLSSPQETVDPDTFGLASRERAHDWLHEARGALRDDFTVVTELAVGEPGRELEAASDRLDLLVLGSRGYGPLRRVLLGSISSYLVERCRCPVIVVPRGSEVPAAPRDEAVGAGAGS
jgi:nucleotide-binding universal stress UspA family protein